MSAACQAGNGKGAGKISPCPTCVWRCVSSTPSWAKWTATRERIIDCLAHVEAQGADIAAFPELAITGYPPEDLLLKPAFVAHNLAALEKVAAATAACVALVGFVDVVGNEDPRRRRGACRRCGCGRREAAIRGAPAPSSQRRGRMRRRRRAGCVPQATASQLRRIRRGALVRAGDHRYRAVRGRRHGRSGCRSARTCGFPTGRCRCRRGRGPARGEHQCVAVLDRAGGGPYRRRLPARDRGRVRDRLRQPGRRSGRARLRRRLVRHGRRRHASWRRPRRFLEASLLVDIPVPTDAGAGSTLPVVVGEQRAA